MIGQTWFRENQIPQYQKEGLPGFNICVGGRRSGKTLLAKEIAKQCGMVFVEVDATIDAIRDIIPTAHKSGVPILFFLRNAHKLSQGAKNALLKITEEPPKNAYFYMTIPSQDQILPTLWSRANHIKMEPYTEDELLAYARQIKGDFINEHEATMLQNICKTPGEVDDLLSVGIADITEYSINVIKNIGIAPGANALKITSRIAFKDEDKGFPYRIFLQCIIGLYRYLLLRIKDYSHPHLTQICKSLSLTMTTANEIEEKSINKSFLFDMFLLSLRELWLDIEVEI